MERQSEKKEVEAVLQRRQGASARPSQEDLATPYEYLRTTFTSSRNEGTSASATTSPHWFCSKCPENLHREVATYLVFLFAFAKSDNAQLWLTELEGVLCCLGCARGFGIAKKRFKRKYLSSFPEAVVVNFFAAVHKWTIALVEKRADPEADLDTLDPAVAHLVLAEPTFLDQPSIAGIVERTKDYDRVATYGLTALYVQLAAKEAKWSVRQCARQPLTFRSWCDEGVGQEIQALYAGEPSRRSWNTISSIMSSGALFTETIQRGLLGGKTDMSEGGGGKGLMAALVPRLSGSSPLYQSIFQCFATLLRICHDDTLWSFDPSPELPHTLFASIKNNPSFTKLLEFTELRAEVLACLRPYLLSLIGSTRGSADRSAFGETLAKVANYAFSEMQHSRLGANSRADVAKAGLEAVLAVEEKIDRDTPRFSEFSATLDIHSAFIAGLAFRQQEYPSPVWDGARQVARNVISTCIEADNRDAMESTYALAIIASVERQRRAKKSKGMEVADPKRLDKLHQAFTRKSLLRATYNAVQPRDPGAVAMLMEAVSRSAHLDLLDADNSWSAKQLSEVVFPATWTDSVNAVNVTLKSTREHFAQAIESFSLQGQETLLRELFVIPRTAHAAMLLLLSPDDSLNEAVLSLIQQAFGADDRSEAFKALLKHHPMDAVDALSVSLQNFSALAQKTPESCSLAKRLVRCFAEILDALCNSDDDEPLLMSDNFMSAHRSDTNMRRQISGLWHLLNTALAVIYKRTPQWAVWFENSVMTDWMRDALILGSQLCDKVRLFESAVLGVTGTGVSESPAKVSNSGKTLVSKLHVVLRDLTLWLRLTDVEILYQTFNLIKSILQRTAKANFDVTKSPELQESVSALSKFVSRPSKSYSSKLSEDKISELSELLAPFSPSIDDEVEFLSDTPARSSPASSPPRGAVKQDKRNPLEAMMDKARRKGKYLPEERKDAFAEMMKKSQGSASKYKPAPKETKKSKPVTIDDFEDDFLDNLSTNDLDVIEKRAKISAATGRPLDVPPKPSSSLQAARSSIQAPKLNINVVPRPVPKKPMTAMGKLMRETRREWDRPKVGGVTPSIPAASSVGSGLGAYQPSKPKPVQKPDSDTSESDSSDDGGGMSQLIEKMKKPVKLYQPEPVRRTLQVMEDPAHIELRRRQMEKERHARRQKRLKPDLGPLFRFVLSWDPTCTDPQPPHPDKIKLQLGEATAIPPAFSFVEGYDRTMLVLFLQELWAQSLNEKGIEQDIATEVTSRSYEDDWIDVELAVIGPWPERTFLNDSDIVILSQPGNPKKVFARIQGVKKTFKQANIKVRIVGAMDVPSLIGKNKWLLRKHLSLSTALREFGALRGLPYYEPEMLLDILAGRSAHLPILNDNEVRRTMSTYDVNEPQAKAIIGSTRIDGFALIQGPPGTGKTKTISGLVGKWISDRPNPIGLHHNPAKKQKLLVCAPSNAAIDEVCKRLMMGVPTASGERRVPMIVRIGIDNSVNDAVKDRSLDNLVEARVSNAGGLGDTSEYGRLQVELEDIKGKIHSVQQQLSVVQNDEKRRELEVESHNLNTRRVQLGKMSSKAKDAMRDANRHLDGARRAAKTAILEEADIVCATLSGSGQEILAAHEFETVIIDEAAQAIELACLIPLKYGCKRCIMVGDPNQLPPTTFSSSATKLRYNESLFVRMANLQPQNMHLLSIQYRMHPDISALPSKLFYKSRLADGPDMASKTAALWHTRNVFGPYRFFDVRGMEERQGTSTKNRKEAQVAVQLYKTMRNDFGDKINLSMRVGIISMYREQIYEVRRAFSNEFGPDILSAVEFNTVDGFQGQEKDIIILSTVRSGPDLSSIGFLRDFRRMNVALTRAKSSLFVIGNADTLARCDEMWRTIVGDARDRGYLIQHNDATFRSLAPPPKPAKIDAPPPKPVERIPIKRKTTPPADLKAMKKVKEEPLVKREREETPLRAVKKHARAGSSDSSSSSSSSDGGLDALIGKKPHVKAANGKSMVRPPIGGPKPPSGMPPPPPPVANGAPPRFVPGQSRPPPVHPQSGAAPAPVRPPPPIVHRAPIAVAAETAFRTKKKRPMNGAVRPPGAGPPGPSRF